MVSIVVFAPSKSPAFTCISAISTRTCAFLKGSEMVLIVVFAPSISPTLACALAISIRASFS